MQQACTQGCSLADKEKFYWIIEQYVQVIHNILDQQRSLLSAKDETSLLLAPDALDEDKMLGSFNCTFSGTMQWRALLTSLKA